LRSVDHGPEASPPLPTPARSVVAARYELLFAGQAAREPEPASAAHYNRCEPPRWFTLRPSDTRSPASVGDTP
jgi:hypothetical protein